jgi:hypothetical protein
MEAAELAARKQQQDERRRTEDRQRWLAAAALTKEHLEERRREKVMPGLSPSQVDHRAPMVRPFARSRALANSGDTVRHSTTL